LPVSGVVLLISKTLSLVRKTTERGLYVSFFDTFRARLTGALPWQMLSVSLFSFQRFSFPLAAAQLPPTA
jgi:hypothetical protein